MIVVAVVITAICLALAVPLVVQLAVGLFMPWPAPRAHHAYGCPECPCSYQSAAGLARHHSSQHADETLVLNAMVKERAEALETFDRDVVELGIRQEVP